MKMRWKFICCILLSYCVAVSFTNERSKRDLLKLKKFFISKLLKQKVAAQSDYRIFRIAGFNNIMVKELPTMKVVRIPIAVLKDKTSKDNLKALEEIKTLLKLGILNDKDDKIIQEIIVPIFQTTPVKFTTTDVTETYLLNNPPKPIVIKNPAVEVTEVVSLVPDDTKYSYKQISKDKETTTFVSQYSPNTVITTTKNILTLPLFIKNRIEEVASMGFNPYAFATPGAVIPARPPILVKENIRVPMVTQGANFLNGVIDIYNSPLSVKPPEFIKETVKVPTVSTYISETVDKLSSPMVPFRSANLPSSSVEDVHNPNVFTGPRPFRVNEDKRPSTASVYTSGLMKSNKPGKVNIYRRSPFIGEQRPPTLVKESVNVSTLPVPLMKRPPILIEETNYFNSLIPGVVDNFNQSVIGKVPRPPILVKETVKVPAFNQDVLPRLIYPPSSVVEEQNPSIVVKDTLKIPEDKLYISTLNTRDTVKVNIKSGNNYNTQLLNDKHVGEKRILPPPTLSKDQSNSLNNSEFSYTIIDNINTKSKISTNTSNADSRINKGPEKELIHLRELPSPPTLGDFNNSKGFSYRFVSTNQAYNRLKNNTIHLIDNEARTDSKYENLNNGTSLLSSFIPVLNVTKSASTEAESVTVENEIMLQIQRQEIKSKPNKNVFAKKKAHNKEVLKHNQDFNSSFFSLTNSSNNLLNLSLVNNKNFESETHRGDIPPSLLLSYEKEDNFKEFEINNSKNISTSNIISTQTTTSSTQSSKMDDTFILSNLTSPSLILNKRSNHKNDPEVLGYTNFGQLNTSSDNLEILGMMPKINVSFSSLLPTIRSEYNSNIISPKYVSNDSISLRTADNADFNTKYSLYREDKENNSYIQNHKNQSDKNLFLSSLLSRHIIDPTGNQKDDSRLNSTELNLDNSFRNKSHDAQNTIINTQLHFNSNNTIHINNTKSVLGNEIDKELSNLRKNKNPTKAFMEAEANLNQIENKLFPALDTNNINVTLNNTVNLSKTDESSSITNQNKTISLSPKKFFGIKRNSFFPNTRQKFRSERQKNTKTVSILSSNNSRISNATASSQLLQQVNNRPTIGGILIGTRSKLPISLPIKKGNNQKPDNKYASNPSRKAAINRLMGRNETNSNNINSTVSRTTPSQLSHKQTLKTSSSNGAIANKKNRRIIIGKRLTRGVNKVYQKIPNHYLYVPPIDVFVPPPIKALGNDKVKKSLVSTHEILSQYEKNHKHINLNKNHLIVLNGNSDLFLNNSSVDLGL